MKLDKDVIVVLGCSLDTKGDISFVGKERVEKAVELFNKRISDKIIMSGKHSFSSSFIPRITEAKAMKEYAELLGVPKKSIFLEEKSKDTIGNAYFVKVNFLKKNNWKNIVVITSDLHIKRAKFIFKFIFGNKYNVGFIGVNHRAVPKKELDKRIAYEKNVISILKKWLKHIKPGDDKSIKKLLYEKHPGYSKNSKFTKKTLLEFIKRKNETS